MNESQSATTSYEERVSAQAETAGARIAGRTDARSENLSKLESGGIAAANPPERITKRLDRLSRYLAGEQVPVTAAEVPAAEHEAVIASVPMRRFAREAPPAGRGDEAPAPEPAKVLERIINKPDLLGVRYLEGGVAAARSVGRIDVRDRPEHLDGYGTGSLVSPRLVLTNHHVLPDRDTAASSAIEFNFQDDLNGRELEPQVFAFDPDAFFLADEERDFALVAVKATAGALDQFGSNPLIEAEGKGVIGEYVTIVQHPRGLKKQVALRENKFVDIAEPFVHYTTDTEPGSSGSPVFNDQWEIVALHHAGVPAPGHDETGGFVNEGILVRKILEFVRQQDLQPEARALADQLTPGERVAVASSAAVTGSAARSTVAVEQASSAMAEVTVPLELTIQLRSPGAAGAVPVEAAGPVTARVEEKIEIDPDYADRAGYDPAFLGEGALRVDLPALPDALQGKASINTKTTRDPRYVLQYHHYSVVMNKERRLAFFTAVNIDGALSRRLKREQDRWFLDPRIPAEEQTGEPVYLHNKLDRGHLVRRLDPAWGESDAKVKIANDDTFHFTNCTPQHEDFNQNKTTWAGLEDYILENADNLDFKVNVFSGPVLADDDDEYRGVKLPRQFWKVVTMVRKTGQLSATGYLLSQESLIEKNLEVAAAAAVPEEFSYGAYRTFQVPITQVEQVTGLSFGELSNSDPLAAATAEAMGLEAMHVVHEVESHEDLVL